MFHRSALLVTILAFLNLIAGAGAGGAGGTVELISKASSIGVLITFPYWP